MALTSTERARRSRRHAAGDHSLCDPARGCRPAAAADVDGDVDELVGHPARDELVDAADDRTRGQRLHARLVEPADVGAGERVLAEEAGRLADRLDKLEQLLQRRGDAWARFERESAADDDGRVVTVVVRIDAALAEARQHALALKAVLAELRTAAAGRARPPRGYPERTAVGPPSGPPSGPDPAAPTRPAGISDIRAQLAHRRPQAAS